MKINFQHISVAAAGLTMLAAASTAHAQGCPSDRGLLEFLSAPRPQCAVYQGDYMVNRGPVFSGPALIAPQHTYAPTPTAFGYPYVHGDYAAVPAVEIYRPAVVHRIITRRVATRATHVRGYVPPRKNSEIIRAKAEVKIYSPHRMDIRLYRN